MRIPIKILVFLSITSLSVNVVTSQVRKDCFDLRIISTAIQTDHIAPRPLDDSLSASVFDLFIEHLDPTGLFFLQPDIDMLRSKYRYGIDDMIRNEDCSLVFEVASIWKKRLDAADKIITTIMENPLDLSEKEELEFSRNGVTTFAIDEKSLKKRWTQWLKYQVLEKIFLPVSENDDPYNLDTKTLLNREEKARQEAGTREKRSIKRKLEHKMGYHNYVSYLLNNAFAASFDPHTFYFSWDDQQDFVDLLSTETYSFGIEVNDNFKNEVEIVRIIPGGAGWKSNQLSKGDVLLSVRWEGNAPVDLSFSTAREVMDIFFDRDIREIELTVRKVNGVVRNVRLRKTKIRSDENAIRSFILSGDKKVGYISLPSFYLDLDGKGHGCANDVAKELILLKKDNIEGLILDLRNNGGGSVQEALDLAGIFIDIGPVTISTRPDGSAEVLKDMNRGTIYDGPLIVLVNSLSASASEIFTAALQDYNRALVVGSTTYGKSTGQVLAPLYKYDYAASNTSFIKLTTARYNRITGSTHQLRGVLPDIHLPDLYEYVNYSESLEPYALSPDTTFKKAYYKPLSELPIKTLSDKSKKRVDRSVAFNSVINIGNILTDMQENIQPVPLYIEGYKTQKGELEYDWTQWEKMASEETDMYTITNTGFVLDLLKMDTYANETNQMNIQDLESDIYVQEAYRIMLDFLNLEP